MVILTSCGEFSITEGQEKEIFYDILDETAGYDAAAEFKRWTNRQEYDTKEKIREITAAMEEHELAADNYYSAIIDAVNDIQDLLSYVKTANRINRDEIISLLNDILYDLDRN